MRGQFIRVCLSLALLLGLHLTIGNQAAAISKLAVPELDEHDLPFYLDKPLHDDNTHLYLFSSLPLISRQRASASFQLANGPSRGITPLLDLEVHPPVDVSWHTEFFDVTIWGQLNNLFQKNLELLALEREIITLFTELEEVNSRYMALLGSQTIKPLTLDRRHYLQRSAEGRADKQSPIAPENGRKQELLSLIQQHDRVRQSERLASQLAARARDMRAPMLESHASAAASMRASEAQQDPESTRTLTPQGRVSYAFRLFRLVLRYLLENKIEAIIYLWLLILLSASVKAVFRRP